MVTFDQGSADMATQSANVMVRVEPEVKEQAEKVMEKLGLLEPGEKGHFAPG